LWFTFSIAPMNLAVKGFISSRVHSVDWIYSMLPIISGYPNSNCIRNLSNDFFSLIIERNQTGGTDLIFHVDPNYRWSFKCMPMDL
jgi:hypothetical protein